MSALLVAALLAAGTQQLVLALLLGRGLSRCAPRSSAASGAVQRWMRRAGLTGVRPVELSVAMAIAAVLGGLGGWLLFAGPATSLTCALGACAAPVAVIRGRHRIARDEALEAWPQLIEEIRLGAGALGRSIPVALLDAGANAPGEAMRAAFAAAGREWLLTTDFERCTTVLTDRLDDATADAVCEMLLVAHELGGRDLDRRLGALAEDRRIDLRHRAEARSRQSGARFSRWFVLVVPIGMAAIGTSIGGGRAAYRSVGAQAAVCAALAMVAACWWWAGRIMHVPEADRVLGPTARSAVRSAVGAGDRGSR